VRTGLAAVVVGLAAALGTVTGAVVLPDRREAATGRPSPASATPSAASPLVSATPSASPTAGDSPSARALGSGPVRSANMLTTADFQAVGLTLTPSRSDARLELQSCADGAYKRETLAEIAVSGPPVERTWDAGQVGATEEAIAARDADEATTVVKRILKRLETCQRRPPGYFLHGPTHTERLGPATTASWVGVVDGTLNTTGRAPKGAGINGGIAVLRRGAHVALLEIGWCESAGDAAACVVADGDPDGQLAALSRAAALRLG